ncbi:MAG: hypothetical protein J0L52_08075 [Caulobacterales bacterium]|nr:hypothetical protein [Caulobacterales bacterium]
MGHRTAAGLGLGLSSDGGAVIFLWPVGHVLATEPDERDHQVEQGREFAMKVTLPLVVAAFLAACQPAADQAADADADRAEESVSPSGQAPAAEPPPAYVGSWVADLAWCQNTVGPERPIVVTATEFQGYENTCQITQVSPTDSGWDATFVCQAEGTTSNHPVGIQANADRLEVSWRQEGYSVAWRRCPA